MSAQGSPNPSSAHPPRQEHLAGGANPLRRTSDRIESWVLRFLMVVLLFGLPAASLSAGRTAYESNMDTVRAQAAERHQVTARLLSDAEGAGDGAEGALQPTRVRWTDNEGEERTGTALVKSGTAKGSTARIWLDREGAVAHPPMSAGNATATGWLVGGMAALAVAT
ncbi:Rv1733c family protein, partial [Streptomyces scabiei]|uniref:Rv1733c family protein n=2 Tax=Streptomyces TaxID=1883 RepID=UPI000A366890